MEFYTDTLKMFGGQILSMLVIAFIVVSVVRFIIDCVRAKRQHRKVKTGIKVMFIIAVIGAAISAILTIIMMIFLMSAMFIS